MPAQRTAGRDDRGSQGEDADRLTCVWPWWSGDIRVRADWRRERKRRGLGAWAPMSKHHRSVPKLQSCLGVGVVNYNDLSVYCESRRASIRGLLNLSPKKDSESGKI